MWGKVMVVNNGYCYAYREAWTHPAFNNLREAAIWNFLYQNAYYEDGERNFNGHTFLLKRGQLVISLRFLANGFGMTEKGARVVIQKLEKLGMVGKQGTRRGTIITICNYEKYQRSKKTEGAPEGNQRANRGRTEGDNNKKESNKEKEVIKELLSEFRISYPLNKRGFGSVKEAEVKLKLALKKDTFENILQGVRNYENYIRCTGQSNKDAFRWLEKEQWRDDYSIQSYEQPKPKGKSDLAREALGS